MPPELPPELAKRVERLHAQFDRGLVTHSELQNELLEAVHNFAGKEYERTHPEWAKDALFDRAIWETEFEAKRQAETEAGAAYALAVARSYEHADGLVDWVFSSPQWHQALQPVTALLSEAGEVGPDAVADKASLAWVAARRGVLPTAAREVVRGAAPGNGLSMVDLLESDREGDPARVAEIIAEAGQRGCASPAIHVLRLRRAERRRIAAPELAALLDPTQLAARGEPGGITHIAVELLADGADDEALRWSSAVDDSALFHAPAERPGVYSGWEPFHRYHLDRQSHDHSPNWCVPLCDCGDARLLGALAAVDWLAGDPDRAQVRAAGCDRGSDPQGWSASGVDLLAEWVASRPLDATDRTGALSDMIENSDRSHVDLGLLGVQIHGELAELSTVVDDHDAAAHHQARSDWFTARPEMRLHFESFQFQSLLHRLPLVNTEEAEGSPENPGRGVVPS